MSPYVAGGRSMAATALRPLAVQFMELLAGSECEVDEFQISNNGQLLGDLNGRTLAELELRKRTGALVLAVRMPAMNENNPSVYRGITSAPLPPKLITNPNGDVRLLPGQLLVVMGSKEELQRLAQLLGPAVEGVEAMTN